MSAAPAYKGDGSRANPELLLVSALSSCQALTYLFLAARAGVAVTAYTDDAEGHLGDCRREDARLARDAAAIDHAGRRRRSGQG